MGRLGFLSMAMLAITPIRRHLVAARSPAVGATCRSTAPGPMSICVCIWPYEIRIWAGRGYARFVQQPLPHLPSPKTLAEGESLPKLKVAGSRPVARFEESPR